MQTDAERRAKYVPAEPREDEDPPKTPAELDLDMDE